MSLFRFVNMQLSFKCYRSKLFSALSIRVQVMAKQFVSPSFKIVDEIPWCAHSNETSSAVLSHGTIYLVCSSNFWVCGWNPLVLPFKWNIFGRTFAQYYLFLGILEIKTNSIKWRLFIGWTWTALLWLLLEEKGFVGHFIREIKSHVYGKRKQKDSSWEFLRIENKDITTFQIHGCRLA